MKKASIKDRCGICVPVSSEFVSARDVGVRHPQQLPVNLLGEPALTRLLGQLRRELLFREALLTKPSLLTSQVSPFKSDQPILKNFVLLNYSAK